VTDTQTGLMWGKKTGVFNETNAVDCSLTTCSDPHNVNNEYTWSAVAGVRWHRRPDGSLREEKNRGSAKRFAGELR
jgi:hypothetical protein